MFRLQMFKLLLCVEHKSYKLTQKWHVKFFLQSNHFVFSIKLHSDYKYMTVSSRTKDWKVNLFAKFIRKIFNTINIWNNEPLSGNRCTLWTSKLDCSMQLKFVCTIFCKHFDRIYSRLFTSCWAKHATCSAVTSW